MCVLSFQLKWIKMLFDREPSTVDPKSLPGPDGELAYSAITELGEGSRKEERIRRLGEKKVSEMARERG